MRTLRLFVPLILLVAMPLAAQSRQPSEGRPTYLPGTGNPDERLPVWMFVEKGAPPAITTPLVVYWLPSSAKEMEQSPLLDAHSLLQDTIQCVALVAILPGNTAAVEKLGAAGKLPIALLVDRQGNILRRAENVRGNLKPASVEQMVKAELGARDEKMYHDMTEAKKRADAGDKAGAIDLYKKIWDDRCLFPLAGREAQSALKTLGVIVQEPPPTFALDPNLQPPKVVPTAKPKPQ